jgi:lysophospholipase L1-like esterase
VTALRLRRLGTVRGLRRLLNLAGVVFLVLVAAELALRAAGAVIAARVEKASHAGGARSEFTIACVGDSWTQGRDDGRYPEILEAKLNARSDGRRYRVVNLGLAGTNSSQALKRLSEQVDQLRPRIVLVLTGNNDHWNLTDSVYWKFADGQLTPAATAQARLRIAVSSLRLYRLARTLVSRLTGGPTPNEFFYGEAEGLPKAEPFYPAVDPVAHRRQLEHNLTRFVELGRDKGAAIVFLTYFHFHGYHVNEIVADTALRLGVPLVDNTTLFHTRIPVDRRGEFRVPDGHPSPKGYAFIADNVIDTLVDAGLVPRVAPATAPVR